MFAVGTDRQQGNLYGTAIATLAVPLSNGTCADVRFGYAIENDGTRQLAFSGAVAPWHAACTGQAALAAGVPFSVDPGAGLTPAGCREPKPGLRAPSGSANTDLI